MDPSSKDALTSFVRHGRATSITEVSISDGIGSSGEVLIPKDFIISASFDNFWQLGCEAAPLFPHL